MTRIYICGNTSFFSFADAVSRLITVSMNRVNGELSNWETVIPNKLCNYLVISEMLSTALST